MSTNPPQQKLLQKYCQSAQHAARIAGAHILASLKARETDPSLRIESKGGVDLVTEVDRKCEEEIIGALRKEYPTHAFVGEESTYLSKTETSKEFPFGKPGEEAPTWIIDPLDGTTNFCHSYPLIAVSIALALHQQVVVSVIYLPATDQIYTATKHGGAFRNNTPIHISHAQTIGEALLVNNIGSSRSDFFISHTLSRLHALLAHHNLQGLRMSGSACVNLAHVSDGTIDVYIEDGYGGVWDVAAGSLLVTEAGGVTVCVDGSPWKLHLGKGTCVAGGKEVVEEIVEKVRRADRWYWLGKVWGWMGTGAVGVCVGLLVAGGMKGRKGGIECLSR